MCDPVTMAVASAGVGFMADRQQGKAMEQQQNYQNEIARKNAMQQMASEELRIRQVSDSARTDIAQAKKKVRVEKAKAMADAGESGVSGNSVDALYRDYMREEGEYQNAVLNNLAGELVQHNQNMKSIQIGQQANSTSVTKFNPMLSLASRGLQAGGSYFDYQSQRKDRQSDIQRAKRYGYGNKY
jgi:hypothetical protein